MIATINYSCATLTGLREVSFSAPSSLLFNITSAHFPADKFL